MVSLGIKFLGVLAAVASCLPLMGQPLCEGDLLFACSDSANAITAVTSGVEDLPIDHVGIVHRIGGDQGPLYVIEAVKPVVCLTPIDSFLCQNGMVIVGRINVDMDVKRSIRQCLLLVGRPYDNLYLPGDSAIYCSELVQRCYVNSDGKLVFNTIPMSFHDETGQVTDYWNDFYSRRGMIVPEGEPGSNPGELSRRSQVTIIGNLVKGKFVSEEIKNPHLKNDN